MAGTLQTMACFPMFYQTALSVVYSMPSLPTSITGVSTLDDLVCMNGGFLLIFIVYSMNSWLCNNEYIIYTLGDVWRKCH